MSKIKKHKIEVSSGEYSSDFVVDLRSGKKDIVSSSLFEEPSIEKSSNLDAPSTSSPKLHSLNNVLEKKEKKKRIKVHIKRAFNENRFQKILFYPLIIGVFKIVKAIVIFFFEWIVDICRFLKKIFLLKFVSKALKFIWTTLIAPFKGIKLCFRSRKKTSKIFKKNIFSRKRRLFRVKWGFKKFFKKIKFNQPKLKRWGGDKMGKQKKKKQERRERVGVFNFNKKSSRQSALFKEYRPQNSFKSFFLFFLFLLLVVVIFKGVSYYNIYKKSSFQEDLISLSLSGIQSFSSASEAVSVFDFYHAYNKFNDAGDDFSLIDAELKKVDELVLFLSFFSDNQKLKAFSQSKNFSKAGIYLSSLGNNLSLSLNSLFLFFSEDDPQGSFKDFSKNLSAASGDLKKANKYLKKIKAEALPADYQELFVKTKNSLSSLEDSLLPVVKNLSTIEDLLGVKNDKRYLLVFQNNAEIRAGGGFVGSYAIIDVKNGKIVNIEIPAGGSYDTEGGMKVAIESPRPLHLVKSRWYFWDANWWPDWMLSAKNLMWFLEKSGGPSVDGVISFTPNVLGDLLDIFGSVDLTDKYGLMVDASNFQDSLQEVVEVIGNPVLYQDQNLKTDILEKINQERGNFVADSSAENIETFFWNSPDDSDSPLPIGTEEDNIVDDKIIFQQNKPKEIIVETFEILLERIMSDIDRDRILKTFFALLDNLNKKNILLYFDNKKLQEMAEDYSWAGKLKNNDSDYLMIVDSNIAGAKSDRFLKKNYHLQSAIQSDGKIINKLTIERDRRGEEYDLFSGLRNVNWLRVYVPLGSKLIKATGFVQPDEQYFKKLEDSMDKNSFLEQTENSAEIDLKSGVKIYKESGKTVFANWTMTDIGQLSVIEIEYELPRDVFSQKSKKSLWDRLGYDGEDLYKHSLLWQKQAGAENSEYSFVWTNDARLDVVWSSKLEKSGNIFESSGDLDLDKYFSIILK